MSQAQTQAENKPSEVEFGLKAVADTFRAEYSTWVFDAKDMKQSKTVVFKPETPDKVLDAAAAEAAESRDDRDAGDSPGQIPLTEGEKSRIDFSADKPNTLWARSIKGVARDKGVDDWTSWVDETLSVDEHRPVMEEAKHQDRGQRLDAEKSAEERLADASRAAAANRRDNVEKHCRKGDRDAYNALIDEFGYPEEKADRLFKADIEDSEPEPEPEPEPADITPGSEPAETETAEPEPAETETAEPKPPSEMGTIELVITTFKEMIKHEKRKAKSNARGTSPAESTENNPTQKSLKSYQ